MGIRPLYHQREQGHDAQILVRWTTVLVSRAPIGPATDPDVQELKTRSAAIARIDRQHHRILAILDRARYLDADDRLGRRQVAGVLVTCFRRHLSEEENLLRSFGYPECRQQGSDG
jgi:hypothetical protein